jgi:hypothetical protein
MLNQNILVVVPVLSLIGSGTYIYAVLKGKAKPNRVTWILWALAPLIAFAAQIHAGVSLLQSLLTFMAGFGPLLILVASFISHRAVWKLTKFDFVCGGLSLLGLVLWMITREGNVAILFSILADGLAGLPTLVKSYREPESESSFVFSMAIISSSLTLLTLDKFTFTNAAFTTYILSICVVLVLLIRFKLGRRINALFAAAP